MKRPTKAILREIKWHLDHGNITIDDLREIRRDRLNYGASFIFLSRKFGMSLAIVKALCGDVFAGI